MLQVEAAGSRLEAELARVYDAAMGAWQASSSLGALKPKTVYDSVNGAVWLKAVAKSPVRLIRIPPHTSFTTSFPLQKKLLCTSSIRSLYCFFSFDA